MNRRPPNLPGAQRLPLLVLALLALLGLFPPESRGESLAGCALLLALAALLLWPGRLDALRALPLALALPLGFGLWLTAEAPGAAVEPLALWVLAIAAGAVAAGLGKDLRAGRSLPLLLASIGALVAIHALAQRLGGLEALAREIENVPLADRELIVERARAGRAFAAFPTPAALSGYLAMLLPLSLVAAWGARGRQRWALVAACGLQVLGLLAAASIAAVAALAGALLLALARRTGRRVWLVAGTSGLIVLLTVVALLRGGEFRESGERNSPWRLRAANARSAVLVVTDHPWSGVGPGGFGEVYPQYRGRRDNETRHVHNLPLELAAEVGVPLGLGGSLVFFYLFLGPLYRKKREAPDWWFGAEIGLAAFALHNLADFTAFLPSVLWTAAIVRGWISRRELSRADHRSEPLVFVALAATILAAALAAMAGPAWNERLAARHEQAAGRHDEAFRRAERAARLAPWSVDGWMILAVTRLDRSAAAGREADLGAALADLDRAVYASPVRPAARALRSRIREGLGDLPGAYADARQAAALYPGNREYAVARDELARRVPRPEGGPR